MVKQQQILVQADNPRWTEAINLGKDTKDGDTIRGRDEDLSVGDDRGDKLVTRAEVVTAVGCLVAVVELVARFVAAYAWSTAGEVFS